MSSLIQTIQENSEKFVPAFALVHAEPQRKPYRSSKLNMNYLGGSPTSLTGPGASPRVTPPDEHELGRWVLGGGCVFTVSDKGMPVQRIGDRATANLTQLYGGYAEIVLTDRRLLGAVFDAETLFGRLTRSGTEGVLLLTLDLDIIDGVVAHLRKGLFGGVREKRIAIRNTTSMSMFTLAIDHFISGGRVLEKLVDAIARRRHEGPIGRRLGTTSPAAVLLREDMGQQVEVNFVR